MVVELMTEITWTNTRVKLGDLKPWADNPRQSSKIQARRILQSFEKFGQVEVVAVGPGLEVYDGHQRLSALLTIHGAGYELDARQASRELSDAERRELVVSLHAGAVGSWDWDRVSSWDASELQGWGMDKDLLKAWNNDANNLKELLKSEAPTADAEPQTDRAQELLEKWQVSPGDMFAIGDHRLICGDCTDAATVARVMGGEKGIVFADAPYGVGIVQDNKVGGDNAAKTGTYAPIVGDETTETAEKFYQACLDYGFTDFILWGGNYFTEFLPPSSCWIVWDKRGDMNSNNFADCELAWTSFDEPARVYKQVWAGMIREDEHEKRVHPTQKPVRTTQEIMTDFPADVYLDGFSGSGTTLVACENLRRRCRAIEVSPAYVAVALERMATAFPHLDIHRLDA
jgi:site-specific DNA-methyltransferase (adenine-specific)